MIRGKILAVALLFVGAVAVSVTLLHSRFHGHHGFMSIMGCSRTGTGTEAYRSDLNLLSRLSGGPSLVKLTDGGESASEILSKLCSYHALVVVTAGRSTLTRRAEVQPFISIAPQELSHRQPHALQPEEVEEEPAAVTSTVAEEQEMQLEERDQDELVMQSEGQQQQQQQQQQQPMSWRRRRAVLEDGTQPAAGAGAGPGSDTLYDNGLAALARVVGLMNTAAAGVERVLGRRLFPITISTFDRTAGGTLASGPYAIFDASAGALLLDRSLVSYTWGGDMPQVSYIAGELATRVFSHISDTLRPQPRESVVLEGSGLGGVTAAPSDAGADMATSLEGAGFLAVAASSSNGGGGAAAAARIAAAALAVALPAAFGAAPPLWFCILCPSVLGLLAPLLINLALNQIAGLLCTQLHLDDQACFDVLLGALGAGFVLSLASAVPIFFVCRLPECAGKNVTAALQRLVAPALRG